MMQKTVTINSHDFKIKKLSSEQKHNVFVYGVQIGDQLRFLHQGIIEALNNGMMEPLFPGWDQFISEYGEETFYALFKEIYSFSTLDEEQKKKS